MNPFFAVIVSLLALFWANGCATQADLQAVRNEGGTVRTQIANTNATLDSLRREIDQVRGAVEEVRHRLDRLARERLAPPQLPQLAKLEERVTAMEEQLTQRSEDSPVPPSAFLTGEPQLPATDTPSIGRSADSAVARSTDPALEFAEAQDEYRLALQTLRAQQYDRAIQQFRTFQRKYPNSVMADDAQYWIGESYFIQKDYNRAILEFNDVLQYRRGDKVPDALLRQAQAFLEIGDQTDARLILQKLVDDYPNSEPATEARERLQTLR